jgi:hypothetical protein
MLALPSPSSWPFFCRPGSPSISASDGRPSRQRLKGDGEALAFGEMYAAVVIARRENISRGKFLPTPTDIDLEGLAQFQVDENNQLYWARRANEVRP